MRSEEEYNMVCGRCKVTNIPGFLKWSDFDVPKCCNCNYALDHKTTSVEFVNGKWR